MQVDDWRLHQLIEAGYSVTDASELAVRNDVDLHKAVDLVGAGCPADTAARILL